MTHAVWSQSIFNLDKGKVFDTSNPPAVAGKNPSPVNVLGIPPAFIFNEFPVNHNMHIASDGNFYYTINGGNSSTGQINKFDLNGNLLQTYPIQIDGRGLSYNYADSNLYASLYTGDIVRIDSLAAGTYTTLFIGIMHDAQASFAISPDGTKFYDFVNGTLYVHDFFTGVEKDTIYNLAYGAGNFGGNAAVAVDSNFIYTWDATIKTVSVYDQLGTLTQTMVLDSGDNGHSISIANGLLFVSRDGNYATGTWYGYGNIVSQPLPVSSLASSDTGLCEKQTIDFFDLSTNNPTSWHWYFPNASPDTSSLQNPTSIYYNAYGSYDVALVACNSAGCDSLFLPGFISVFQSPPQPLITQSNDTLFCSGSYTFAWYESTNPTLTLSTDSFYVVTQNGNYYVLISDSNGCAASSNIILINTGISGLQGGNQFGFFPNPASGKIYFNFTGLHSGSDLQIYNVLGECVLNHPFLKKLEPVDLIDLHSGIYVVKCASAAGPFFGKLVIKN